MKSGNGHRPFRTCLLLSFFLFFSIALSAEEASGSFGRLFIQGKDSDGFWSSLNCGSPDSSQTHVDVSVPDTYRYGKDPVLAPLAGTVLEIYTVGRNGSEGSVVTIVPDNPLPGLDDVCRKYGLDISTVHFTAYHLGHIRPLVAPGDHVNRGDPVGTPFSHFERGHGGPAGNGIAFCIRVGTTILGERQFNPGDFPNEFSFAGKIDPDSRKENFDRSSFGLLTVIP